MSELQVLLTQLSELLTSPIEDEEDALEVAEVAGLVARLDPTASALSHAEAWRDGEGAELLDDAFDAFDAYELLGEIERAVDDDADAEVLEEVLSDLDDAIAAAVWCGRADEVAVVARQLRELVRENPAVFSRVAEVGEQLLEMPGVMADPKIYAFWKDISRLA